MTEQPSQYSKYVDAYNNMIKSFSKEDIDAFSEKSHKIMGELCEQFTRENLESKCNTVISNQSEFDKMEMCEKDAYLSIHIQISHYKILSKGFTFIKSIYKDYSFSNRLYAIVDKYAFSQDMWQILYHRSMLNYFRMIVIQNTDHTASIDDIISILKMGRAHHKRAHPTCHMRKYNITDDVVKNLVFADQDTPDNFTGFLFVNISYFEKDPTPSGFTETKTLFNVEPDLMFLGIFPIDTCQEEFRNIGCVFNPDHEKDKKYTSIHIKTSLIRLNEDHYSINEYLNFYDNKKTF